MRKIVDRIPADAIVGTPGEFYLYDENTGMCRSINAGEPQVFWAVYGKTTYDEIVDAYGKGKVIICVNGDIFAYPKQFSGSTLEFLEQRVRGCKLYKVTSNNAWTSATYTHLSADTLVSPNGTKWSLTVSDTGELIVTPAPVITVQPVTQTVLSGDRVTFSVEATGASSLSYDWYIMYPGETSFARWGKTNSSASFACQVQHSGMQVYCVVTDAAGNSTTSNTAILTVEYEEPTIVTQPTNQVAKVSGSVTFAIEATGTNLSYQWYIKRPGESEFTVWSGKTEPTPTFVCSASQNGLQVYCVITDAEGATLTSNTASLILSNALTLTEDTTELAVYDGTKVYFHVSEQNDTDTYQWYIKRPGESGFTVWSGKTTSTPNFTCSASHNGLQVYCEITSADGSVATTGIATLYILTGKAFVAFGTSITANCAKYDGGYLKVISDYNGFDSYLNAGTSGMAMANNTAKDYSINYKIRDTDITNYELAIIECCSNDFKLNVPLGTVGQIGDTNFNTDTFCGALRDSIEYILATDSTKKIVLIADPKRDKDGYDVNFTNSAGCKLIDYVNALISIATLYNLPVCDWYRDSGIDETNLSVYTDDGLHPNAAGYELLGNCAAPIIASIYNES